MKNIMDAKIILRNILKWAKKNRNNTSIVAMILMLIIQSIFYLPVIIPLVKEYGWFTPIPYKYCVYFGSIICLSYWLTFEIIRKFVINNENI